MTKQEKIQEAYGEYWDIFKDNLSHDGWTRKSLIPYMNVSEIQFINKLQRPITLKGIETNNGWIKYYEKDMQKWTDTISIVFTDKCNIYSYATYCNFASIYELEKITHFQQLKKPEPPIY